MLFRSRKIRAANGFVFVTGEYNWGIQPGLKNLTDHFLEEWFWRPAAIVSYSAGRLSGARAATAWHGTLSEMGMVVVSSTIAVGPISQTLSVEGEPVGEAGKARPSHGSRTISCGGSKLPRRSGNASNRPTDRQGFEHLCGRQLFVRPSRRDACWHGSQINESRSCFARHPPRPNNRIVPPERKKEGHGRSRCGTARR